MAAEATVEIQGILSRIRFAQDGYMIGALDVNSDGIIPIKGPMLRPELGLEYKLMGRWDDHPKWGRQFAFNDYRVKLPTSADAVEAYLVEHCRWIGIKTARRVTEAYGSQALEVLKNTPHRVAAEIQGITTERADEIAAKLRAIERDEALDLALKDILANTRISKRATRQIKEKWGADCVDRIKANPFELIKEIDGVGFHSADRVAKNIGYDHCGAPRIDAGVLFTLEDAAGGNGHTCLPKGELIEKAAQILDVEAKLPTERIVVLLSQDDIVENGDRIYLASLYDAETTVAAKIQDLLGYSGQRVLGAAQFDGLKEDQVEAVKKAVEHGVFLLTGAPGTGKTYTVKQIIQSFPTARIALAAPTGKAARRMSEQCGREATTMHKLLGGRPNERGEFEFEFSHSNPIPADLIVLDEVSMVDIRLMASFLRAVAPAARLILVGDFNQLPSVGPGNVLRHLIDSGTIPMVELTIIKRQNPGLIVLNCHAIKDGRDITVNNNYPSKDFFFLERDDPESIRQTIIDLATERLAKSCTDIDPVREVQVITALREKTTLSCRSLNEVLQEKINKNPKFEFTKFRLNDKVIQLRNTQATDVETHMPITLANGDIGYVQDIREKDKKLVVEFELPRRVVEIDARENNLDLAYALTVHKYQGSEAPIIIVPIHRSAGPLILQRNWVYTSISRAKRVCILVGQRSEMPAIIARKNQQVRYSKLAEFLKS